MAAPGMGRVKRRIAACVAAGVLLLSQDLLSLAAYAQQTEKAFRVGLLWPGPSGPDPVIDAFKDGLREHGYTEGQNIVVERVDADFKPERFAQLAAELVRHKVDVIVVWSTSPARAVK